MFSPEAPPPPGSGSRLPPTVLTAATASAAFSIVLSLWTIWLQWKNYRQVRLQRAVVRILIMVPIYAGSSLISLYSLDAAFFLDAVRDIYEAFVIYCFFTLLTTYLGGERSLLLLLHGRDPVAHPWPIKKFLPPMDISDPFTFLAIKRGILQYVQLKPILAFLTVLLKATNTYRDGDLSRSSGYTYISVAYNVSVSLSLYCLAMFWIATNGDLKPFRPVPKFLCVKGIIFFSFWQGFMVSILVAAGIVKSARYPTELLSLAIQDTLICFEMPLFAILHLYAFSYTDYIDPGLQYSGRLPVTYAIRDTFGGKDVWLDSMHTAKGSGFSYRTFEPAAGALHQGLGRERRVKAGLRYANGGKTKYWLPQAGAESDAYGRRGKLGVAERPFHAIKRVVEERWDERQGYAPIAGDEAREVIHDAPLTEAEEERREYDSDYSNSSDEGASDIECLEFDDEQELGVHMEAVWKDARRLEFGDFNSPVIDASKEEARRRMWEEEEARAERFFLNSPPPPGGRSGSRYGTMDPGASTSAAGYLKPDRAHVPPFEVAVAAARKVVPRPPRRFRRRPSAPPSDSEDGASSLDPTSPRLNGAAGASKGKGKEPALPPDAVDLVVEDPEAEQEEMVRDRRRGEPLVGKRRKVFKVIYSPEPADNDAVEELALPQAAAAEADELPENVVEREAEDDEAVKSVVKVREQVDEAVKIEPPETAIAEPVQSDRHHHQPRAQGQRDQHERSPWEENPW